MLEYYYGQKKHGINKKEDRTEQPIVRKVIRTIKPKGVRQHLIKYPLY